MGLCRSRAAVVGFDNDHTPHDVGDVAYLGLTSELYMSFLAVCLAILVATIVDRTHQQSFVCRLLREGLPQTPT